jgi:hypothetical protein
MRDLVSVARVSAIAACFALVTGAASAATLTEDVSFTASGFTSAFGQPVPVDPVNGDFTITYDPTKSYMDSTVGISFKSLNLALDSPLSFSYSPNAQTVDGVLFAAGELVVSGSAGGVMVQFAPPSNDFWLHVDDFASSPTFDQVGYSQVASGGSENLFFTEAPTGTGSVTLTPVPEPAAWAMILVGVGVVGGGLRMARRNNDLGPVRV